MGDRRMVPTLRPHDRLGPAVGAALSRDVRQGLQPPIWQRPVGQCLIDPAAQGVRLSGRHGAVAGLDWVWIEGDGEPLFPLIGTVSGDQCQVGTAMDVCRQ